MFFLMLLLLINLYILILFRVYTVLSVVVGVWIIGYQLLTPVVKRYQAQVDDEVSIMPKNYCQNILILTAVKLL